MPKRSFQRRYKAPEHIEAVGPSPQYMREMEAQQAIYDEMLDWERELVMDYGLKKALAVLRLGRGKRHAKTELETLYGKPLVPRRKRV